ncbi:MAG TPA: hypothetical protein VGB83_05765 [Actinomycetota bacterium]
MAHAGMHETNSGRRRRGLSRGFGRRLLLAAFLVTAFSGQAASADPLVCASLSYRVLGGTEHHILEDDCYVPTPWTGNAWLGPTCGGVNPFAKICYTVTVTVP